MNRKEALNILKIEKKNPSNEEIKKQYKMLALLYHPDRNPDGCEKFQEISAAYTFLTENEITQSNYKETLMQFLYSINLQDTFIYEHIYSIMMNKIEQLYDKIQTFDTETLIKIYRLLVTHSHVLGVSETLTSKIKDMIISKMNDAIHITLRPTLDDLYQHLVYKLDYEGNIYRIPLWHHELIYNHNNKDLYIQIEPDLPNNVNIDENNNIIVNLQIPIEGLWDTTDIDFNVNNKTFTIKKDILKLKRAQQIVLEKKGIPLIHSKNIYDVSKLSHVLVNICIDNF